MHFAIQRLNVSIPQPSLAPDLSSWRRSPAPTSKCDVFAIKEQNFQMYIGLLAAGLSVLLVTGVLKWKDCLNYPPAWDTLFWFAVLVGMSGEATTVVVVLCCV